MRQLIKGCYRTIMALAGLLLSIVGIGTVDTDHGRILAIGLVLSGLSFLPYPSEIPEWQPAWTKPLHRAFSWSYSLAGIVALLFSLI